MATSLLERRDARELVKYLTLIKVPFDLIRSNYAMEIKSELINDKFVTSMQGKQVFAAFAKIKSNVKNKPIPAITRDSLIYYQHNFKSSFYTDRVYNIDLNCAYATALFNKKLIAGDTLKYLLRLPKQARLVSVGMLASRKKTFSYGEGMLEGYSEYVSEYAPFFYLAVQETYNVMSELKKIIGQDYLFTWVDGVYFKPNDVAMKECEQYLQSVNFGYKSEVLNKFMVKFLETKIMLTFNKWSGKKQLWESKVFNLPHKETISEKIALSIINNKKIKA